MEPLTKSCLKHYDPNNPVRNDLTMYKTFEEARDRGFVGEIVDLETGRRVSTSDILIKGDKYAKGLLALACAPGEDSIAMIGSSAIETTCMFAAASSIGVAFAKPFITAPKEASIVNTIPQLEARIVVIGEADEGKTFNGLINLFEDCETPTSSVLPLVKHVFYDNSYKDRSPEQKYLRPLEKLIELGEEISDEQLDAAKKSVRPEFTLGYLFSSGSTDVPKCIALSNGGMANEVLCVGATYGSTMSTSPSMDELASFAYVTLCLAGKLTKVVLNIEFNAGSYGRMAQVCTEALAAEKVEILGMVGHYNQLIANYCMKHDIKLPLLKYVMFSGQITSRQYKETISSILEAMPFTIYGSSEAMIMGYTPFGTLPTHRDQRLDACLMMKPNSEIRLVDGAGSTVDIGQEGELCFKSYSMFNGYKGLPEKTKSSFTEEGFFKTGDIAIIGPDGSYQIKGRCLEALRFKVEGKVAYPGPIEEMVSKYPGVQSVSVVRGKTNDAYGDEVVVCICLAEGVKQPLEEDVLEHMKNQGVTCLQMPARIFYFDRFPTTANGRKVSKPLLMKEVEANINADSEAGATDWYKELCRCYKDGSQN